jgi:lipopolysaccharide biosynthesis protein
MKSVCFFASYFTANKLPYYITVYLKELKKHFKDLIFIAHRDLEQESLEFLNDNDIRLFITENEGYDFGSWYRAIQKFDISNADKVAFINDSTILFKSLGEFMKWSAHNEADLQGITSSEAISPHIQSYFLSVKKAAIPATLEYFNTHKIITNIKDVIHTYEVGLSKHLQERGLKIASFMDNKGYKGEFSPYYYCVEHHLANGMPVIKKKILFASYRKDELFTLARMNFNISEEHYISLIKKYGKDLIIDFEKLKKDKAGSISELEKLRYRLNAVTIRVLRPLYKSVKND